MGTLHFGEPPQPEGRCSKDRCSKLHRIEALITRGRRAPQQVIISALGLVSRASPVQTAVRNCTRDEGGPFGFGDQVADPKPPQAAVVKSHGGERCGNAGTMIPAGTVERGERKRTVSEVSKAD